MSTTTTAADAYPLAWPANFPRAKSREKARFNTTLPQSIANVKNSIALFAKNSGKVATGLVISSNCSIGDTNPRDPGVSVWFTWDGLQVCIPVDRYQRVEHNLQAIHLIIEARRVELRHGTLALMRATFQGFAALPAPSGGWRKVLGFHADAAPRIGLIETEYKRLAMQRHPDQAGGSAEAMAELNAAMSDARRELEQ